MKSESAKLISSHFTSTSTSSGSETEGFIKLSSGRRGPRPNRKGGSPNLCKSSLGRNRRQCQIFGVLLILTMATYLFSSGSGLFQDTNNYSGESSKVPLSPKVEADLSVPPVVVVENTLDSVTSSPGPDVGANKTSGSEEETSEETTDLDLDDTTDSSATSSIEKVEATSHRNRSGIGCKLPKLNPFDPSILNISRKGYEGSKCRQKYPLFFNLEINPNGSSLVMVKSPEIYGWKDCCYNLVFRKSNRSDNEEIFSKECYPIQKKHVSIPPDHEFLAISCNSSKNSSLTHVILDIFALAPIKPEVEARITSYYKSNSTSSSLHPKEEEDSKVNLVILGLDAVSHMNFQRIMPRVHKYLIKDLSAYWLDGYIKVGDNTLPNALAMLGNLTVNESFSACSQAKVFSTCPLIWSHFASTGYRTSYSEDSPWMGIFNYLVAGFTTPPTDYYLRPIARVAEEYVRSDHRGNAHICYGPRLSFQFLLEHMRALATSMGLSKRYFQFVWATSLTHDYVNVGHLGEPHLLSHLVWMRDGGYLDKTVMVLASDHGIRWGPLRATAQGKIEDSMPFLYFIFPPEFRTKYSQALKNLEANRNVLTTPFDAHETFLDISNLSRISDKEIRRRTEEMETDGPLPRGISLFLPIPRWRRCEDAAVEEHYCVCHSTRVRATSGDPEVQQAANYALFALNSKISGYSRCAYLTLGAVGHALEIKGGAKDKEGGGGMSLDLSFSTLPGNGSFDATLVRSGRRGKWTVSGSISRTNLYGNSSYCVDNTDMKKYCYCLPP